MSIRVGAVAMVVPLIVVSVAGWRNEQHDIVMAGRFGDEDVVFSTGTVQARDNGVLEMHFPIRRNENVCLLSGQMLDGNVSPFGFCADITGEATIACNDASLHKLRWIMTSCDDGFGWPVSDVLPSFYFGFGRDKSSAVRQLRRVVPLSPPP